MSGADYNKYDYADRYEFTIARANTAISEAVSEATRLDKDVISVLDYGCASGRYLPLLESLSKETNGKPLVYTGYEPFVKQLHEFEVFLDKAGFRKIGAGELPPTEGDEGKGSFDRVTYRKDNLTINLVHGNVEKNMGEVCNHLPMADVSLCLFGTLSHIPNAEARTNVLKLLKDKTAGDLIASVPNVVSHKETLAAYDNMRMAYVDVGDATAAGDIFYERKGEGVKNYYHLYNRSRLDSVLEQSGLSGASVEVCNLTPEVELANKLENEPNLPRLIRDNQDAVESELTSSEHHECEAQYWLVKWHNPERVLPSVIKTSGITKNQEGRTHAR